MPYNHSDLVRMDARIMRDQSKLDAAESAFFARELEHIRADTIDVKCPDLMARVHIPEDPDPPNTGAATVTYRQFTKTGVAKVIASYADDLPRADLFGVEFESPIRSLGEAYGYNIQEIRAAILAGRPLTSLKAQAAREAIERGMDEILSIGHAPSGIPGFLNNVDVPAAAVAGGVWSTKTPTEIRADVDEMIQDIPADSLGIERSPVTIVMPDLQFDIISDTQNSDASDRTILEFLLMRNNKIAEIVPWYRMVGAGAGGLDRMIAYDRTPRSVRAIVPQEFEQFPIEPRNLEFVVSTHARVGGTNFQYPLSARYRDGI